MFAQNRDVCQHKSQLSVFRVGLHKPVGAIHESPLVVHATGLCSFRNPELPVIIPKIKAGAFVYRCCRPNPNTIALREGRFMNRPYRYCMLQLGHEHHSFCGVPKVWDAINGAPTQKRTQYRKKAYLVRRFLLTHISSAN